MAPRAQPLAQDYGLKPGSCLIGNFGSTERRFVGPSSQPLQRQGPGPAGSSGPAAPAPQYGAAQRRHWGTEPRALNKAIPHSPGPGEYGGSAVDERKRSWPNAPGSSAFSSNAERSVSLPANTNPGPGAYEQFADRGVMRSPSRRGAYWPENARVRTGAQGHTDLSKSTGRRLNWHGADETARETPGPSAYHVASPEELARARR